MRVIRAIENSEPFEQKQIAQGLTSYAKALVACRTNPIVEVSKILR